MNGHLPAIPEIDDDTPLGVLKKVPCAFLNLNALICEFLNIQALTQLLESRDWQGLCKDIGKLELGLDVDDVNFSLLLSSTHEEETHVYLLCTLVVMGL